jgi:transposase
MAPSMHKIVRRCFPMAKRVIDRFHVQKPAYDALQEIRIAHRWDAINEETDDKENAKLNNKEYIPLLLENGDTKKQLLARSRYLLFKSPEKWTDKQKLRAKILFERYPDIKKAYSLTHSLRMIFSKNSLKDAARLSLARWYNEVGETNFKSFNTISATIYEHYEEILNFFNNRSTNASAESFNAKIKAFRAALRGVADISFFLFRLTKIYA